MTKSGALTAARYGSSVLHKLLPVVVVADWIIQPAAIRLIRRDVAIWMIYPLVWTGATLLAERSAAVSVSGS